MERLHLLDLPSLELRLLHIDLIWCDKILFGIVHISCDDFFFISIKNQLEVTVTSFANKPAMLIHAFLSWAAYYDFVDFRSLTSFKRTIGYY